MMAKKYIQWCVFLLFLLIGLAVISIFSLCVGPAKVSVSQIFEAFLNKNTTVSRDIILNIRLPRIILAIVVGGALSISGVILQGMFRNPLVEPYTLGISGGAVLGICLSILLNLSAKIGIISFPLAGFLGSILSVIFVYFLSLRRGVLNITSLLLYGVMISYICSSLFMLIMAFFRADNLQGIIFWMMGSLGEPEWIMVKLMCFVSLLGLLIACLFSLDLNALLLGEEQAQYLGVNTERTKKVLFLLTSFLTGAAVSSAGIIGFVGLIVPHVVRMLFGHDNRMVLIASYILGAIFLVFCDTISRTIIAPLELPLGVVTGIVGGIFFIYAIFKKQSNYE